MSLGSLVFGHTTPPQYPATGGGRRLPNPGAEGESLLFGVVRPGLFRSLLGLLLLLLLLGLLGLLLLLGLGRPNGRSVKPALVAARRTAENRLLRKTDESREFGETATPLALC